MRYTKPLVVVLSRNYSTGLSVIKSLGTAGFEVDLIASANKKGASEFIAKSKYVKHSVEVVCEKVSEKEDKELLAELLSYKGKNEEKPILFPTDDYTTSVMDLNRDILDDIFMMPSIVNGSAGSLKHLMDKSVQGKIAREVGILTPEEWTISLRNDEIIVPDEVIYPCYCKPLESSLGYKQEMLKCNNKDELLSHLYKLKERFADRSILVQKFLEIDEEIDIEGVCLDDKIIMPGIIHKEYIGVHDKGVPLAGKTYDIDKLGDFKEKLIEFLKQFHYYGMFDLGLNIVGDKIYFNEINMRSGGTNYVYYHSGVNLPELFIKGILNVDIDEKEVTVDEYGKKYVYEKIAWEDYLHGNMKKDVLDKLIAEADIKNVLEGDDEEPKKIFEADLLKREKNMISRNKYLKEIMDNTGWSREVAVKKVNEAHKAVNISLRDYTNNKFWRYTADEQKSAYSNIIRKRERVKKQKEICIDAVMNLTEWNRTYAEEQIEDARKRLGISYNHYMAYNFCTIPVEEQGIKYDEILNEIQTNKDNSKCTKEMPLVVVLSRNYSTGLSVIRSLGAAGYTVDLIANAYKSGLSEVAIKSKYVRNHVEIISKKVKDGEDIELLNELLKYENREKYKPVLFPTDDYTTSIMDLNRDILEDIFIMPSIVGGKAGTMVEHMDKTVQGDIARAAGLLTPNEWIISLEEEIDIPEDITYPCFCKPIESITGYKKEMKACDDEDTLRRHLTKLKRKFSNRSILVQEFLNIENEIDLSGVCIDQEVIIPAIIKKTNVAQHEKGVTLAGRVVPFDEIAEIKENIIDMMKRYHYVGMFDLEFNIVGDKIYFNEVNLRSGGPNYSYFKSGVNLPEIFVKEVTNQGHCPEEEKVKTMGQQFIYEKVAWDDYIYGYMTKKELNDNIKNADIRLLLSEDDPEPGKVFTKIIKKKAFKQKCRRIKKNVKKSLKRKLAPILRPLKYKLLGYPQTKKTNQRDPNSEKPRVLVAGRNYCSNLTMARSLGEAGYEVEVLRIFQVRPKKKNLMKMLKPDAYSKYIKGYYVCVSRRRSKRIVRRLISLADENRKMLLIPADDLVACIADDYLEQLSEYYYLPNVEGKEGEINHLMSKGVQKALAKDFGLPVLNSCVIKTVKGEFEIPETVNYPCFIKPNISKNSSKSRMRKCNSEEELRETLTEFSREKDIEMLVEDYVEIAKEYSILGLGTEEGAIGPGFFVAEEGGQLEHRGVAITGRILPCSFNEPLIKQMVDFVASLKFTGLYDVDLIETVDGKIYFVEVNMRFGASGYAVTQCGVNLPGMFADYMLEGKEIDMNCEVKETNKTFVSEKVLIEEYVKDRISMAKLKVLLKESDIHFVQNDQDSKAYRHFKKFYFVARLMRIATKYKEKKENN